MSNENSVAIRHPPKCPDLSERVWWTESRFLFAKQSAPFGGNPDRSINIEFMAGRGCVYSATVELIPSDYAREMARAVIDAIDGVNRRWGLPQSSIDDSFTGMHSPVSQPEGKENV
ncbi:hypothetical protein [Brucella sp. 10RB9213]|uniref:hypothetical protein n=1 Tax=Brucella sp. 10RB9213 TaxID=1844039 RepID=UPI0012AE4AFE|nr:hypothetical protein [Brucella sp. 10RB9213]MRN66537.1 hypothetical protein [Brucella sp. 10RB9213]